MLCVIAFVSLAVTWRSGHSRLSVVTVSRAPVRLCSTETASPWGDVPLDVQQRMHAAGYVRPLPIQRAAMAPIANGSNVVLHAATGSGKTLAYLLPALVHVIAQPMLKEGEGPLALVLAPTRELAVQIHEEAVRFGHPCSIRTVRPAQPCSEAVTTSQPAPTPAIAAPRGSGVTAVAPAPPASGASDSAGAEAAAAITEPQGRSKRRRVQQ